MEPLISIQATMVPLPRADIDTDQIMPKQFLKRVERTGYGEFLFHDWRRTPEGDLDPNFVLNKPEYERAEVLVTGRNFGSGSSREHAPWSLMAYGFQAVIARSFADIFQNNALKNGLLPVAVDAETHQDLMDLIEEAPMVEVTIDLEAQRVYLPGDQSVDFPVDGFAKSCLLKGVDQLGYLISFEEQIKAYEEAHGV